MSTRIASAVLELLADDSKFTEGLKKASDTGGKFSDEIASGFLKAQLATEVFKEALDFVGAAFSAAITKTADFGDKIHDASAKYGLSATELSKLSYQAELSGTNFDAVAGAVGKMSKNMDGGSNAFVRLGINVKDASGHLRPTGDVLGDVADKFSHMEDGAQKTALAVEIFGKSGADMIPMLNEGRDGLAAMGNQAERLGRVMSDKAAAAGDAFNDALSGLEGAAAGLSMSLGEALLPPLTTVIAAMTDIVVSIGHWLKANQPLVHSLIDLGQNIVVVLVDFVARAIESIADLVGTVGTVAHALGMDGLAGKLETVSNAGHSMALGLQTVNDKMADNFYAIDKATKTTKKHTTAVLDSAESIKKATEAHDKLVMSIIKAEVESKKFAKNLVEDYQTAAEKIAELHMKLDNALAAKERTARLNELSVQITNLQLAGIKDMTAALKPLLDEFNTDLVIQNSINETTAEATKAMGINVDVIAELTGARREDIIAIRNNADAQAKAAAAAKAAAESYERVWEQATSNVVTGFVDGLDNMIFHSKNAGEALVGIAQSTAESMFKAFLTGLFSPMTTSLSRMGKSIADAIMGNKTGGGIGGAVDAATGGGGAGAVGGFGGLGALGTIGSVAGLAGAGWMLGKGIAHLFGIGPDEPTEDEKYQAAHPDAWKSNGQWFLPPVVGPPSQAFLDSQRMAEQQSAFNLSQGGPMSGMGGAETNARLDRIIQLLERGLTIDGRELSRGLSDVVQYGGARLIASGVYGG